MEGERVIVCVSLAVGVVNLGPTTVNVTLHFRGNTNKTPPKSLHHQFSELWTHPFAKFYSVQNLYPIPKFKTTYFEENVSSA